MKKLYLLLLCIIAVQFSFSQTADETAVAKAVNELKQALIDADSAKLDALTLPGLSYGHSTGLVEDKAAFIKALVTGKSDFSSIQLSEQTISIQDKNALVRHILQADIVDAGTPASVKIHVLTVWVKSKQGWKLLARQATKVK